MYVTSLNLSDSVHSASLSLSQLLSYDELSLLGLSNSADLDPSSEPDVLSTAQYSLVVSGC